MKEKLEEISRKSKEKIAEIKDSQALNDFKVKVLGKKGELTEILRGMKDIAAEERPAVGSLVNKIRDEIVNMKHELRDKTKIYSKELLEALFFEFYTKIPYIQKQLGVSDKTAQKYLDNLVELGMLTSEKVGRERIYRNERLFKIIKDTDRD